MPPADPTGELHGLVRDKLRKVFGEARGAELLVSILTEVRIDHVRTTEELVLVAAALQRRGGFEATTGAMLAVQATMRQISAAR